jgi:hypothetical protein
VARLCENKPNNRHTYELQILKTKNVQNPNTMNKMKPKHKKRIHNKTSNPKMGLKPSFFFQNLGLILSLANVEHFSLGTLILKSIFMW